jgi:hypothetical protein
MKYMSVVVAVASAAVAVLAAAGTVGILSAKEWNILTWQA